MGEPKKDVNACEDFITTITSGLVVAAALSTFELNSVDDQPAEHIVPGGDMIWTLSSVERRDKLLHLCGQVYDRFVQFAFDSKISASTDSVYEYTMQLLRVCLFYAEFADGIREGDGGRVLRCWKYTCFLFLAPRAIPTMPVKQQTLWCSKCTPCHLELLHAQLLWSALSMYMEEYSCRLTYATKLPKVPFGFWGQTSR